MKKLNADLEAFLDSMIEFIEVLEDKYESPVLEDKLAYFHDYLVAFSKSNPQFSEEKELRRVQESQHYTVVWAAREMLEELESINAESNVFDVIDVLRRVCSSMDTAWAIGKGF
jgi:hypothetical protein